ncbi:MAG: hypothetical protein Q8K72_04830, partial [Acidimicrobiales bacterium]|nr:hypothetical protein [Acidimicrobiales bacterium]
PAAVEARMRVARPMRDALRRGRLTAERAAIAAVIPPDPTAGIKATERQLNRLRGQRRELATGTGPYRDGPVGHAVWELHQAEMNVGRLQREIDRSDATRKDRRRLRSKLAKAQGHGIAAGRGLAALTAPELAQLDAEEERLTGHLAQLQEQATEYGRWVLRHPEAARRIDQLGTEIEALDERLQRGRGARDRAVGLDRHGPWREPAVVPERDFGIDL